MDLPPGFRFHPTDEELVAYYLRRKVAGRQIEFNIITEVDLYKQEPWDLPEKSGFSGSDMEWYFFSPRDKKYPNGLRTNRATEAGYWKATGKDRNVKKAGRNIGMKKTLVFYRGRAPHGERTDWVMHEYRLNEEESEKVQVTQDLFVVCRVFKKSGVGPRSGDDRGQTYVDDDIVKEPSGSFAEAVKKALEPATASVSAIPPAAQEAREMPAVAAIENIPLSTPNPSVQDYAPGEETSDAIDMSAVVSFGDYILDEPSCTQNDEQFWDCMYSLTEELDLPITVDGLPLQVPSELFGAWEANRDPYMPSGMVWSSDRSRSDRQQQHLEEEESNLGAGFVDPLELELLETDDVLPPLVEELESNDLPNHSQDCGLPPNYGDYENQMLRGRGHPRASSRSTQQQPPSAEAQQCARINEGLERYEAIPQHRMSNMNFSGPEVPSRGEDSASLNGMWAAPQGSASMNFDTNQQPSSSDPTPLASAPGSGISGVPEDNFYAFQDSFQDTFYDFRVEDEFNAGLEHDDSGFSFAIPHESIGEQESSEVAEAPPPVEPPPSVQSVKPSKSAVVEGPPSCPSSTQGPSRPVTGLMKLLSSLPVLPASAAECPPDMIHLSAVTVTCTSSVDGGQKVEGAVIDCHLQGGAQGGYQQVVSAAWQTIPVEETGSKQGSGREIPLCASCDTASSSGVLQRRVARVSNSGFVFVFVLGGVSALCWFLLLRGMWRIASHVLSSAF